MDSEAMGSKGIIGLKSMRGNSFLDQSTATTKTKNKRAVTKKRKRKLVLGV
jgi:hypothetical protein